MKQILQNLKTGATEIVDVPCPSVKKGHILVRTSRSLISTGTERMLIDFGKGGILSKAMSQPEKVKMVIDKIKTDGLLPTVESVRNKLKVPVPMGYCNVGTVIEMGSGVTGFSVGDRVASNGYHSEVVCVPKNLCARIPDGVSDDEAAFTVIGAIALQGIRLANPTIGEAFAVTGLGLIGLITVQVLRANGIRVIGIDFDEEKLRLARSFGAETVNLSRGEDPVVAANAFSRGRGVDAVLVTASTKSSDPVLQGAQMCRKRGRIILVGVTGLELSRNEFFKKELTFQVSCSYGPGRYDNEYEEGGTDYPLGFVRWTEQRNFEAVLDLLDSKALDPTTLVSHRFLLGKARDAYDLISGDKSALAVLIEYQSEAEKSTSMLRDRTVILGNYGKEPSSNTKPVVGFIGSGNYATHVLIPAFKKTGVRLKSVSSGTGISGVHSGRKYHIEESTTASHSILDDVETNTIVIATRHDTHGEFVCEALRRGKNVFVEKPLAIDEEGLEMIIEAHNDLSSKGSVPMLMIGFNRRFAPQVRKMKDLLDAVKEPKVFIMTVNAGAIPAEHWTQDPGIGGGRIIGEGCHFIDLLRFLTGYPINSSVSTIIGRSPGVIVRDDKVSFTLSFADGSVGTIHYLANGNKAFPKERLEVFCAGGILQLDNFRRLQGWGWPGFKSMKLWQQNKGNEECVAEFIKAIKEGTGSPIPFSELVEVTRVSFNITRGAR